MMVEIKRGTKTVTLTISAYQSKYLRVVMAFHLRSAIFQGSLILRQCPSEDLITVH